jgi:multidrug transporter EmrE-like cation transporter
VNYLYLTAAIAFEILATSTLKASVGFTRAGPTTVTVLSYTAAFYCLSLALRTIPVGIAYAIWSGIGIVAVTAIGWRVYGQVLDTWALVGMAFILVGVLIIHLLSRSAAAA